MITFRKTGEQSIEKLMKGAGAKPHSILDKSISIKKSNIKKEGPKEEAIENFLNKLGDDLKAYFIGLVGHWNYSIKDNTMKSVVDGVYLTSKGKNYFKKNDKLKDHI